MAPRRAPLVRAPTALGSASAICHGPPTFASRLTCRSSERSTSDSNSGQLSSRIARSRFLSWVESAMTKSRCEARRLAAETSSVAHGAGLSASYAQRRLGDHLGVAGIGLGVAGEQLRRVVLGEAGQVRDVEPGEPGPRYGERPDVADLVDDDQGAGLDGGEEGVERALPVLHREVGGHLAGRADAVGPVRELPHVEPHYRLGFGDDAPGPAHVVSSNR